MRGMYSIPFRIDGVTTAKTLLYITAASGKPVLVTSTVVSNEDVETNEQLTCCWQRVTTLGTPTATTVTPRKTEEGDQAMAATVKASVTASEPTYGAVTQGSDIGSAMHGLQGFPSLGGYHYRPIPEERFMIVPGDTWGLRLLNAPAAAVDLDVQVMALEIGG